MENFLLLGMLTFPLAGVLIMMLLGIFTNNAFGRIGKSICVSTSTLSSILSLVAYYLLQTSGVGQLTYKTDWIKEFAIQFSLKMDGLSAVYCLLTAFVFPVIVGAQWKRVQSSGPMALLMVLQTSLIGTILSEDLFFQCFFWFLSAFPLYFMASLYGKEGVRKAAFSALMFSNVGNILYFIAAMLIYQGQTQSTFSIDLLSKGGLEAIQFAFFGKDISLGMILVFLFGFGVMLRTPLWPTSGWYLSLVNTAPMSVLIGMIGAVFPVGTYLLVRVYYSLIPNTFEKGAMIFAVIGAVNLVVGALGALQGKTMRVILGYSAVSLFGFALIGLSVPKGEAIIGLVIQSAGVGASFVLLGLLSDCIAIRNGNDGFSEENANERKGGLALSAPWLAVFTGFSFLACLSVPGSLGFVGNSLLIMGSYSERPWATFLMAGWFIIFAAVFFKIFKELFLAEKERKEINQDITIVERVLYFPLVVVILWVGLYPNPTVSLLKGAADQLMKRAN